MGLPAQALTLAADERDECLQGKAYDPRRSQPSALYFAAILAIDLSEEGMATEGESGVARRGFETPVDDDVSRWELARASELRDWKAFLGEALVGMAEQ